MVSQNKYNSILKNTSLAPYVKLLSRMRLATIINRCGFRSYHDKGILYKLQLIIFSAYGFRSINQMVKSLLNEFIATSKTALYNVMQNSNYNWRKLLRELAVKNINELCDLDKKHENPKVVIVDDTSNYRDCSKKVEGLSYCFDHTVGKSYKGFTNETLIWTDGDTAIPVDFSLVGSSRQSKQVCPVKNSIDKRTTGYKRRQELTKSKVDCLDAMVERTLKAQIEVDYILMDSWYTKSPNITNMLARGVNVIGMVADNIQYSLKEGQVRTLDKKAMVELLKDRQIHPATPNTLGSIICYTDTGTKVKIVVVKHNSKKNEYIRILSTDTELSDDKIIALYARRWQIEVMYKNAKQYLGLEKKCQARDFNSIIANTSIVFIRYMLLAMMQKYETDVKTMGDLAAGVKETFRALPYANAIAYISNSFFKTIEEVINEGYIVPGKEEQVRLIALNNFLDAISSMGTFIHELFSRVAAEFVPKEPLRIAQPTR